MEKVVVFEYERQEKIKISVSTDLKNREIASGENREIASEVIRKHFAILCMRFGSPEIARWLATELFSKRMLTCPLYQMVLESSTNIREALLEVQLCITHDLWANKFKTFLEILKQDPALEQIAVSLVKEYHELLEASHSGEGMLSHDEVGTVKEPKDSTLPEAGHDLIWKKFSNANDTPGISPCESTQANITHQKAQVSKEVRTTLAQRCLCVGSQIYFDLLLIDTKKRVTLQSVNDVVKACSEEINNLRPCILIEGENGSGKTTFLHHLAVLWAKGEHLRAFSAVLLYHVYVFREDGSDVVDYNLESQLEDDYKLLGDSTGREDILILIDAYWYLPKCFLPSCRKYFPNASIVFSGQPDFLNVSKLMHIQVITHYFKILGYEQCTINSIVKKSVNHLDVFSKWLDENPFAQSLLHRPFYCKMVIELFSKHLLPSHLLNLTELFQHYVLYIINIHEDHPVEYICDLKDYLLFQSVTQKAISLPKFYPQFSDKSEIKSFGLLESIEFNNGYILTFINSSIMAYFMALFHVTSPIKPACTHFNWPVFALFLFGLIRTKLTGGDKSLARQLFASVINNKQIKQSGIFHQVVFELQSMKYVNERSITWYNSLHSMGLFEPDPIALYVLGWLFSHCESHQNLAFNTRYVSDISKCVYYFCKGTNHQCSPLIHELDIELTLDVGVNADECLKHLINSGICKYLHTLNLSGTIDIGLETITEDDLKTHLSGLRYFSISGEFNNNYRNPFLVIPPNLYSLVLHNKSNLRETDYQFVQNLGIKSVKAITIDGLSPEFLLSSIQEHNCHLKDISIVNYVFSPTVIEPFIQWLMLGKQQWRSLFLEGEKVISADTAMCIAYTLDHHQPIECRYKDRDMAKLKLSLKDAAMSVASLLPIVLSVLKHPNLKLSVPHNFRFDLSRFPYIDFIK